MVTHIGHETFAQNFPLGRPRDLEALIWALDEFGVNRELLDIDIRCRDRHHIDAYIHERLLAMNRLEDPSECSIWVRLDLKPFDPFKGQRVLDIICELSHYEGR
jgi:hypothetical protein